jgi:hypothetical protein
MLFGCDIGELLKLFKLCHPVSDGFGQATSRAVKMVIFVEQLHLELMS